MIHARSDYMHIQDKTGKVKEDEPVFLLRARDALAPSTLMYWATELDKAGGDPVAIKAAKAHAGAMRDWQVENGCKLPDTPAETVSTKNKKALLVRSQDGDWEGLYINGTLLAEGHSLGEGFKETFWLNVAETFGITSDDLAVSDLGDEDDERLRDEGSLPGIVGELINKEEYLI